MVAYHVDITRSEYLDTMKQMKRRVHCGYDFLERESEQVIVHRRAHCSKPHNTT